MVGQVFKLKSVLIPRPGSFLTHPGQKFLEVCEISSSKMQLLLPFPCLSLCWCCRGGRGVGVELLS